MKRQRLLGTYGKLVRWKPGRLMGSNGIKPHKRRSDADVKHDPRKRRHDWSELNRECRQ